MEHDLGAAHPGGDFAWADSADAADAGYVFVPLGFEARSVQLRATLDNPDRSLRPGMFATAATTISLSGTVSTRP